MTGQEQIKVALQRLEGYIRNESYRGFDPYDALQSPLFALPILRSNKIARLAAQQVLRRLPFNIRSLLGIQKGYNSVTLGLSLQAISSLLMVNPQKKEALRNEGNRLISEIELLSSAKSFSGHCWGYDFAWQARYAAIPANCPTVVATGIVTNALFEYYKCTSDPRAFELCESAVKFVLSDLRRTVEGETFCFSYSPFDTQKVYNATMKGARLLAQVYSVTGEKKLCQEAEKTMSFVVNNQRPDGSWAYSLGDARTWVDNFHTGYLLDCLDECITITGRREFVPNLEKGVSYYLSNFFVDNRIPKYYSNSVFPIDLTAGGQAILTLVRFGQLETAVSVALYLIDQMQDPGGFFYYRKNRFLTNKISYMRWSNAWMYAALSNLQLKLNVLV